MGNLKWMKLNKTNIDWIPEELGNLNQLESLALARNNLVTLHGEIAAMPNLRSLNCRRNNLKSSSLPTSLFQLQELTILDLSHNMLREVPEELELSKNLLLLNLSNNLIETIPNNVFVSLSNLTFLDLSNNKLGAVRRCFLTKLIPSRSCRLIAAANSPPSHTADANFVQQPTRSESTAANTIAGVTANAALA